MGLIHDRRVQVWVGGAGPRHEGTGKGGWGWSTTGGYRYGWVGLVHDRRVQVRVGEAGS